MNCLFVDTGKEKILIETGIGEKWTERELKIYGIFREKPFAQTLFERTGCKPEDISIVINTHLHFDHAGGNTIFKDELKESRESENKDQNSTIQNQNSKGQRTKDKRQNIIPQFPNARYFVSTNELKHAENPHERDRASYLPENWRPLQESGQLESKPDSYEVVEGLRIEQIRGHSETMQTVCLRRRGFTLYGFADLIPTTAHIPYPWIMGYDLFPTETLAAKKKLLPLAVKENWICLFYHDFETPLCRLAEVEGKLKAIQISENE